MYRIYHSSGEKLLSEKELVKVRRLARPLRKDNEDQYTVPEWLEGLIAAAPWRAPVMAKKTSQDLLTKPILFV